MSGLATACPPAAWASITTVLKPSAAVETAAPNPAGPAPITATSKISGPVTTAQVYAIMAASTAPARRDRSDHRRLGEIHPARPRRQTHRRASSPAPPLEIRGR